VSVASALLRLCDASGARSIAVVGAAKNVGKTVIVGTLCRALHARQIPYGLCSVGRDGETIDAVDTMPKPRLYLHENVVVATATGVLSASPAAEMLEVSDMMTALGPLIFVRTRTPAYVELSGPPSASAVRRVKRRLFEHGAQRVIVDGAVDRLAALAGERDAVVVSTGASAATTLNATVADVGALVSRLRTPQYDPTRPHVRIAGALNATYAAALIESGERRQVVVQDPTRIALRGRALQNAFDRLVLRCECPLNVIAVTVASIGRDRYFEPRAFVHAVAAQTQLPTFDAYTSMAAA